MLILCLTQSIFFQNSIKRFGCIPPSLGNYGLQTCTSYSKYSMPEVNDLIDCPKPCAKYSMRERVEENYDVEYSLGSIKIVFNELITVSYDQYSFYG